MIINIKTVKKKFKSITVSQESTAQLISLEFHILEFHPQTNKWGPLCTA